MVTNGVPLLEKIFQHTGYLYLSDLASQPFSESAQAFIRSIPEQDHPLDEWIAAVVYVTRSNCAIHTIAEAKKALLRKNRRL